MSFLTISKLVINGMMVIQGVPIDTNCYCASFDLDHRCIIRNIEFFDRSYKQALMMGKKDRILTTGIGEIKCFIKQDEPYKVQFKKEN